MNPITHLRRNAIAYVALLAAIGTGGAYAADQVRSGGIAKNAVRAKHIKDGQVRAAEIAPNAVDGNRVAPDSLTGADLDESTLKGIEPAAGSISSSQVKDGSLTGADVKDGSLTGADLDESSLEGLPRVVGRGFLTGVGVLNTTTRCKSVQATVDGAGFSDHVVLTPASIDAEVSYTARATPDTVTYQACYSGGGSVSLNGDAKFLVLRAP